MVIFPRIDHFCHLFHLFHASLILYRLLVDLSLISPLDKRRRIEATKTTRPVRLVTANATTTTADVKNAMRPPNMVSKRRCRSPLKLSFPLFFFLKPPRSAQSFFHGSRAISRILFELFKSSRRMYIEHSC